MFKKATSKKKIVVIHGPNLNLLGIREPDIYGSLSLDAINKEIRQYGKAKGITVGNFQSNHEGEIVDFIQEMYQGTDGIIINPAAYTHYSIAIRDAIAAVGIPTVEVHLSDISNREDFRKKSVIADVCLKQISGLGKESYLRAIDVLVEHFR